MSERRRILLVHFLLTAVASDVPVEEHGMTLEFCTDSSGAAGLKSQKNQPSDQMERFLGHSVNRTHFKLEWQAHEALCGRNVTSYWVDVYSSSGLINAALGWFGHFPQSTCLAHNSKGGSKVRTQNGTIPDSCSPWELHCDTKLRQSTVELPISMWPLVRFANIEFRIRSWGTLADRVDRTVQGEVSSEEKLITVEEETHCGSVISVEPSSSNATTTTDSCRDAVVSTRSTPVVFHCMVFKRKRGREENAVPEEARANAFPKL